jgi:general secretion pathway protein A
VYGRSFSPPWTKPVALASAAAAVLVLAIALWQLVGTASSTTPVVQAAPVISQPTPEPAAAPEPEVAKVAEPVATPPLPDIAELLLSHANETNTASAFTELFALWGATFDPSKGRACDQALQQGLECVYQQGSWGQLRTLNRPAILTLIDEGGSAHQVVVAGLNTNTARLELKDVQPEVPIASISQFWYGDYLILWRPQVASPRALSAGMQGDGVRWLRSSLQSVAGHPAAGTASDYYDAELVRMVEEFQRSHRLNVDGVAGVQTQIVLDTLNNPSGAPLLIAKTAEQGAS